MIPIWIDAGFRANPNIYVGLFFQYGFAFVNTDANADCTQGISCSATDVRLGLNLHYHFNPGTSFDPWLGVGAGYEWLSLNASEDGVSASETASGFEFANFQLGGDFAVAPNFGIGPFFTVTLAEYRSLSGAMDADLATKSIHAWVMGGVRGVFDVGL
jgi:outer membrane protein W